MPQALATRAGGAMRRARVAHAGNRTGLTTLGARDLLPRHAPRGRPRVPLGHPDERRRRQRRDVPQAARVAAGADRLFVLQSAGNLATTQEVLDRIAVDLARRASTRASRRSRTCSRRRSTWAGSAARSSERHAEALGADGKRDVHPRRPDRRRATGHPARLPRGQLHPRLRRAAFLQIGESKYGKFLLEVAILAHADLETSLKIALSSMMSTARANLSVGPPYDAASTETAPSTSTRIGSRPTAGPRRAARGRDRNILNAVGQLPEVELSALRADGESGTG